MHIPSPEDPEVQYDELVDKLVETLLTMKTKREVRHVLESVLSDTELAYAAKRLEIAVLLKQGLTQIQIAFQIGVAFATVESISRVIKLGKYKFIWRNVEIISWQ